MRLYGGLLLVCLLGCITGYSKKKEDKKLRTLDDRVADIADYKNDTMKVYYDIDFRKTTSFGLAMLSSVAYKVADGWVCRDYGAFDSKLYFIAKYRDQELKIKNGGYASLRSNGSVSTTGQYLNNKKNGQWVNFEFNGMPLDTINYLNGVIFGKNCRYSDDGKLKSIILTDSVGIGTFTSFYDDGSIKQNGQFTVGMKRDSVWTFHSLDGKVSYLEVYAKDSLINSSCFDLNGVTLKDCILERKAEYPGGDFKLLQYIYNAIRMPTNIKMPENLSGRIQFVINESGKAENIQMTIPIQPELDNRIIDVIRKMKPWKFAIDHNQPVKSKHIVPLTFY